jgi:hypothetical protein
MKAASSGQRLNIIRVDLASGDIATRATPIVLGPAPVSGDRSDRNFWRVCGQEEDFEVQANNISVY